jgi:serine/alanine adding enzyme
MELDIYYNLDYCKLYEKKNEKIEKFVYESEIGKILNIFLKRKIEILLDKEYYDITTPYGYGGPVILNLNDESKKEVLIQGYYEAFSKYCKENDIVSEFIRFHPIYQNALDFAKVYNADFLRKTIGTNLKDYIDPVNSEFSKSAKREIKNAKKNNLVLEIIENPKNLDNFKKVYFETMKRNLADSFYYFDNSYFDNVIKFLSKDILLVQILENNEILASELYFKAGKILHAHLLGVSQRGLELNIGSLIEATAAEYGKNKGYIYIHHGGGRSNDPEDGLFKYKKKFGKNTEFNFYIGKKIWNKEIYDKLVDKKEITDEDKKSNYFPLYRIKG